jgi:CheY-like chemotaxis protein
MAQARAVRRTMGAGAGHRIELPRGDRPMPPPPPPEIEERNPFRHGPVPLQEALHGLPSTLCELPVLLVDDDATTLELLKMVFETYGAHVTGVRNAEAAIVALQNAPHDAPYALLLSDIGLPGMDGFELLRRVRGELCLPAQRLPAIAVTAWARAEDRAMALRCGFQAHLPKPYEAEQLVATSMRLLGRAACALN